MAPTMPKKMIPRLMPKPPSLPQPRPILVGSTLSLPCNVLPLPHLWAVARVCLAYFCFCFYSFPLFLLCFFLLCLLQIWPCWLAY